MKTFRLTKLLCVFPVLAVGLVVATAVGIPATVDEFAPFESTTSECLICGQMQTTEKRWMQNPTSSVYGSEASLWLQTRVDRSHDHWWVGCSTHSRYGWFASSFFGCGGGIGGVWSLHSLATSRGDNFTQPYLQKYLQLTETGDLTSVRNFVQEEILPALQNPPLQDSAAD